MTKTKNTNCIKNVTIVDNPDGSGTMTYDLTSYGEQVFRKLAKEQKVKFTTEFVNKTIYKVMREAVNERSGSDKKGNGIKIQSGRITSGRSRRQRCKSN